MCASNMRRTSTGFWLEPHTDLGVKKFTMLIYLSDGPEQSGSGYGHLSRAGRNGRTAPASTTIARWVFVPGQ